MPGFGGGAGNWVTVDEGDAVGDAVGDGDGGDVGAGGVVVLRGGAAVVEAVGVVGEFGADDGAGLGGVCEADAGAGCVPGGGQGGNSDPRASSRN